MADGTFDKGKGNVKEAAGDLSGDKSLKHEGMVDKTLGAVKNGFGGIANAIKGVVNPRR